MDNKTLEVLLDVQSQLRELNKKADKINDRLETLEISGEDKEKEIHRTRIIVSKLERRLFEMNNMNLR